ncbi:E3 ubiquitin-protein ligase Midline-1-like [Ostrea edulis]|uniref:E3 ubiquitin-protein ligase Midline-1-like n=1 Tax=Ostrea edulis TaxID=37623 RepID=UPI0024AFFDBE|nr:E3 ubiquitin-protein ligase Midline-1-like [Ostrea edulis]
MFVTNTAMAALVPPDGKDMDVAKCSLCFENYTDPRLLDCFHTFCKECIEQLIVYGGKERNTFCCPLCQHEHSIPKSGADGMKRNFYMEMLPQKKEVQCQTCENSSLAVKRCFDCDQYMCSVCFKTHQKLKVSRSHRSCDIGHENQGTHTQTIYCSKHREEQLKFFCCPCKLNICRDCKITEHEGHRTEGLSTIAEKAKKSLELKLTKFVKLEDLFITKKQELKSAIEATGGDREDLIKIVQTRTVEIVKCIEALEGELIRGIDNLFRKRESDLEKKETLTVQNITSIKGRVQYIKQVLKHGLLPDVTQAETFMHCSEAKLSQTLDSVSAVDACIVPIFVSSKFIPQIDNIGTLEFVTFNVNFSFLCDCPLNHMISEISPSTNSEKAWILYRHLHNTSHQIHQKTGGLYHERGDILSVSRQHVQHIVFRSNDEEVRFAKHPSWFDKENEKKTSLHIFIHDLLSVTVSEEDKIVVLLTQNRVGTVTDAGELVNIVTLKSVVSARGIAVCGDLMYCIDRSNQCVACFKTNYEFVYSATPCRSFSKPFDLRSICCDKNGNVFVCDFQNDVIFFLVGERLIPVVGEVRRPTAVAADGKNRLWIGKENGEIQIYDIKLNQ